MQEEKEISIQELFLFFWKRKFFIILAAIVFALMSFLITRFLITPIYQSSVQFYVNNYEQGKEDSTRVLSSDLSAAQALVNTYIAIIQSDSVLQQVMGIAKQSIELNYTTDQMRKMISAEPINGTEIFKISVQNKDPKAALVIASALAYVVPESITNIIEGTSVKIIDFANMPQLPISPDVKKNVMIGTILGAVLSSGILFIVELFQKTVVSEEDLKAVCDIPVLGIISTFGCEKGKSYTYQYGYGSARKENYHDEV